MIGLHVGVSAGFNYIAALVSGFYRPEAASVAELSDFTCMRLHTDSNIRVGVTVDTATGKKVRLFDDNTAKTTSGGESTVDKGVYLGPAVTQYAAKNITTGTGCSAAPSGNSTLTDSTTTPLESGFTGNTGTCKSRLSESTVSSETRLHYIFHAATLRNLSTSTISYMSLYVKHVAGSEWVKIQGRVNGKNDGFRCGVWFNIVDGTTSSTYDTSAGATPIAASIINEEMADGWRRIGFAYDCYSADGTSPTSDCRLEYKQVSDENSELTVVADEFLFFGGQHTTDSPTVTDYVHHELIGNRSQSGTPRSVTGDILHLTTPAGAGGYAQYGTAGFITFIPNKDYNSNENYYKALLSKATYAASAGTEADFTNVEPWLTIDESAGGLTSTITAQGTGGVLTLGTQIPSMVKGTPIEIAFYFNGPAVGTGRADDIELGIASAGLWNTTDTDLATFGTTATFASGEMILGYSPTQGYLNGYIKSIEIWHDATELNNWEF